MRLTEDEQTTLVHNLEDIIDRLSERINELEISCAQLSEFKERAEKAEAVCIELDNQITHTDETWLWMKVRLNYKKWAVWYKTMILKVTP
jgi:hypothetical protein